MRWAKLCEVMRDPILQKVLDYEIHNIQYYMDTQRIHASE